MSTRSSSKIIKAGITDDGLLNSPGGLAEEVREAGQEADRIRQAQIRALRWAKANCQEYCGRNPDDWYSALEEEHIDAALERLEAGGSLEEGSDAAE